MTAAPRPISLSTVIMAHPRRQAAAERLSAAHPELAAVVVTDPEPDGPSSALRTARLAWQTVEPSATHHLVIQDDAILAPGFAERVGALVAARPDAAISLFAEWGSRTANVVRAAALLGHDWAPVVDDYLPSVALVLPASRARSFAEYAAAHTVADATDDVTLLDHLTDIEKLTPVVQPVDHANPPSLVGNDVMGPRSSANYGPFDAGSSVGPGSSTLPTPSAVPYFCWWEQLAVVYTRDDSAPDGWRRGPAEEALLERGIGSERTVGPLREALDVLPHRSLVHDRVSDVLLAEVWATAFTLGAVLHDLGGAVDPGRLPARSALATLAPGALRRVVPVQWLPAVGELLAPLVTTAVLRGFEAAGRAAS
ncbi:hypothetical protein [Streptomyces sp. NRRL F-5630]|uniref:hypothetical protein n=1 Tax=Streptomyces sp. NRRL F-5630 TaxID=1463864 RepID=UPI003EBCC5F3